MRVFNRELSPKGATYQAVTYSSTGEQALLICRGQALLFDVNTRRLDEVRQRFRTGAMVNRGRRSQHLIFEGDNFDVVIDNVMGAGS